MAEYLHSNCRVNDIIQEGVTKERLGSDQGFPAWTVQAKLPDFHMIFTFLFDKLKVNVTLPTSCVVLSVLNANGGLENSNHSWWKSRQTSAALS